MASYLPMVGIPPNIPDTSASNNASASFIREVERIRVPLADTRCGEIKDFDASGSFATFRIIPSVFGSEATSHIRSSASFNYFFDFRDFLVLRDFLPPLIGSGG